jgi:hypothetical protein
MGEGYTAAEVRVELGRRGYAVTERTLTDWVQKGLLPRRIDQGRGRANGKEYRWYEPDIVDRAVSVLDLLSDYGRTARIPLALWLLGYDMPLETVRHRLLRGIQGVQRWLKPPSNSTTHPVDHLSMMAVQLTAQAARRRTQPFPDTILEMALNVLANLRYRPSAAVIDEFTTWFEACITKTSASSATASERQDAKRAALWMIQALKHLNVSALYEAVNNASEDELRHAHAWWCALRDRARAFLAIIPDAHDPSQTPFGRSAVQKTGGIAIPLYLHLRRAGFGDQIDHRLHQAIAWVDGKLASGEFQHAVATESADSDVIPVSE